MGGFADAKVSLSIDNIEEKDFNKKYNMLSLLSENCLANECISLLEEAKTATSDPILYGKLLAQNKEKIKKSIKLISENL